MFLLLKLLSEAGHQNVLLARKQSPLYKRAEQCGWQVCSATLANTFLYSAAVDVVHAHDARAHTMAALGSQRSFVVSRRVAFPVKQGVLSRWKYGKAARFLAVSRFVVRQLEAAGVPSHRIDLVYDAVQPVVTADRSDQFGTIVALKSDDPGKCRDLIEQAAAIAQVPIVYSDDLVRDFARASLFLYITREEGLGSAALLAMEMGVPVIASKVGGLAEVFEDQISGLYTSNEPTEIANCIRRLNQSPQLAAQLAAAAKKRVRERFSPSNLLVGTISCYRAALGE